MSQVYEDIDPAYAATCSDVTLYSNPKGFFKSFAEEMVALVSPDWLKEEFGKAAGDVGKITAVLQNAELMEALTEVFSRIQPLHRDKDGKLSQEKRFAAQKALEDGKLKLALSLASQAVLKAPMTGELELVDGGLSLALALWLRSEVLLKSDRPQAALEDLKMALKERLPAKMRSAYYWRMGHCYKGAGEPTRAKVSYELAARLLNKDEEALQQLKRDIESLAFTQKEGPKTSLAKRGIALTQGAKQNMPALSKLVKITEEDNKGRFAVASSSIKTGDVLLIEKPYAACLLPDCYGTHCLHCFKRLEDSIEAAPVWCPKCSGVAFCSFECRDIAFSTYHAFECQFLDLFIGSGMSILSHIALRMVTQAGFDASLSIHSKYISNDIKIVEGSVLNDIEGSAKKSRMKSRKERLNRSKKGLKSFDEMVKEENQIENDADNKNNFEETLELKAAQIYSLCTHSEFRKPADYLKRVIMAMFLAECLKISGFFSKNSEENKDDVQAITTSLLCNLQLLQFNAHELYETVRGSHKFSGSKAVYIGVGIYPTGALFNHECYPAVARYFEGHKIVLRANRPLLPGEVISENYGPHFMVRTLKERERALACRYWFKCQCVACHEDWPALKQMSENATVMFKCTNDNCTYKYKVTPQPPKNCHKCSTPIDRELLRINVETINKCCDLYKNGAECMDAENVEEAIESLCTAVDSYHEVACPPHRDTHVAQEALRSCFAAFGNVHVVQGNDEKPN